MQRKSVVDELSDIRKFAVYKTSNKLISLKETLRTERIPYKLVLSVLDIYRLNSPIIDRTEINDEKLENVMHDTFFAAAKQGLLKNSDQSNIENSTKSLTSYLLNIFNCSSSTRTAGECIKLYDLRQCLLILCTSPNQEELIYEHFLLNCDHNRCVTRFRLKEMLATISKILTSIDTDFDMDNWHRYNVIDEWFAKCPGIVGLNEYQFTSFWVESRSIFRNYAQLMAVSQRVMDTTNIVHHIDCNVCKTIIKGLRLECNVCLNYSLCFKCFCVDSNIDEHTTSHRLVDFHLLSKCRSLFKKCWNAFSCRDSNGYTFSQSLIMATIKVNFIEFRQEVVTIKNENAPTQSTVSSVANSNYFDGKLSSIINLILTENEKLRLHLDDLEKNSNDEKHKNTIASHLNAMKMVIRQLEDFSMRSTFTPISSTPYRHPSTIRKNPSQTDRNLSRARLHSKDYCANINDTNYLKGAELNKTFLEQNNSNISIGDVSSWLHTKRLSITTKDRKENLATVSEDAMTIDTDMHNFKELLHIVKDIIEDSYSDNMELSKATNQLENVLDSIIEGEEKKRRGHCS